MSDHFVSLIPVEPSWVPEPAIAEEAMEFLRTTFPNAKALTLRVSERERFIDCGQNFRHVRCPHCSAELMRPWQDAMDAAYDGEGFTGLDWTPPCCGRPTDLNELDYSSPMGFARTVFQVEDWTQDIPDSVPEELARILGCAQRVVHVHV